MDEAIVGGERHGYAKSVPCLPCRRGTDRLAVSLILQAVAS
jgi:hypothetical protein